MKFVIANPNRFGTHPAVKIADANIGSGAGFETFPLYSLGFIPQPSKTHIVELVDVSKLKVPE